MSKNKICPYCAEEIKSEAIKCRFCWSEIQTNSNFNDIKLDSIFNEYEKWLYKKYWSRYKVLDKNYDNPSLILEMSSKSFSWIVFIILLLLWVAPWLIYAIITTRESKKSILVNFNIEGKVINSSMNTDSLMISYNNKTEK
jgi:hypothetical protein